MDYPISLERASAGRILVSFPDFPDTHVEAKDEAEGLRHAPQALASAIDALIRARRAVPPPSSQAARRLPVPALIEAKIRLYEAMRAANLGKADLARRLRWHLPQVDRLFDVNHASRLEQLEAGFAALGKRLVLDVCDDGPHPEPVGGSSRGRARPAPDRQGPTATGTTPFEVQWD